jgi:hypothetical protein
VTGWPPWALWLLLGTGCGQTPPVEAPAAERAQNPGWKAPLDDEAFAFCTHPGADALEVAEWCALLEDAPPDRCPGMRATCDGAPSLSTEVPVGCGSDQGAQGGFSAPPPPPPVPPPERPESGCDDASLGSASLILRWVAAIAAAALVLLVLRVLYAYLGKRVDRPVRATVEVAAEVAEPEAVPDAPSGDLLEAARRALAEGRTGEAVALARAAALRRLAETGRLQLHKARTDREYVRQVRKDAEVHGPLRDVVSAVEAWRWGGRTPQRTAAEAALASAERLIRALIAGSLAWAALEGDARASRYGPDGDAALYSLFETAGYDVTWRLRGLQSLTAEDADILVVDLAEVDTVAEDHVALRAWVEAGGVLMVAGDGDGVFPELGAFASGGGVRARPGPDLLDLSLPTPVWPEGPSWGWMDPGGQVWFEAGTVDAAAEGLAVVQVLSLGAGGVIAVSDSRLLHNAALIAPANEAFLATVAYSAADAEVWTLPLPARVQLATRAGMESESPFTSLTNARLLPFVAQILALGVLVALWRGRAFGPLRDPPDEGRLAFSEHVRALGTRYARLGASRRALSSFAKLWLARLGARGLEQAAIRAGCDPEGAKELVRRAEEAAKDPDGPDAAGDLEVVEELWRITRR